MTSDPLAQTVPDAAGDGEPLPSGARCGRFVVERMLGAGGMGVVLLATDPELGRKVALKLLRPEIAGEKGHARLVREAQAMAKLAHPNVVTVFEVGRAGEQAFVAMELVEGQTLRAWLRAAKRPWREVVAMLVAAGRGLVAAHAAGLVHRDFKPENVLVGSDGRPRVTDFGLVEGGVAPRGAITAGATLSALTVEGSAVGTPGYMSPEQWNGEAVDARGDQFSFCVALWEALYGARPFAGATGLEISARVLAGEISGPPAGHGAPAWIEPLLRRGLATDPAARWPQLAALLDTLGARAAGGKRALAAAGLAAVAVVAAAIAVMVLSRGDAPDPCPAPDERSAAVWSAARRAALQGKLAAIDPALGAARFATAAEIVDRGVAGWRMQHVEACRATRIEGRQSEVMLDERVACLDGWLRGAADAIGALERASNRNELDTAVAGVSRLTQPGACADVTAFALPLTPEGQAEARAIREELDRMEERRKAGALEDAGGRARGIVERARRLDHPPSLAAALYGAVQLLSRAGAPDEKLLEELTRAAAIAGHDHVAAYAWVQLVRVRGGLLDRPEQAEALYATADAALLRAKDPPELRFDLYLARLNVLRDTGRAGEALGLLDRAAAVIAAADPERLPSAPLDYQSRISFARGTLLDALRRYDEAIAAFRMAIAQRTALVGPDHPDNARSLVNIGEAFRMSNRLDAAAKAYEDATRIVEARIGESGMLALLYNRVAYTYKARGQPEEALARYRRAAAIGDAKLPAGHPNRVSLHTDLGTALADAGRLDEALAELARSVEANEAAKRESNNVAIAYAARAEVLVALGRLEPAIADYRRAIALIDKLKTGEAYRPAFSIGLAHALLESRRATEALAILEGVKLGADTEPKHEVALYYSLGRARIETRRDASLGLSLVRAAYLMAEGKDLPSKMRDEMRAFLKKHER